MRKDDTTYNLFLLKYFPKKNNISRFMDSSIFLKIVAVFVLFPHISFPELLLYGLCSSEYTHLQ